MNLRNSTKKKKKAIIFTLKRKRKIKNSITKDRKRKKKLKSLSKQISKITDNQIGECSEISSGMNMRKGHIR